MPDLDRDTFDQLPLAAKQHIDLLCANFENGWKNGTLSRLENVLAEAPEDERPALLAELLHIDIAWRKRRGESPRADDYSQLLPAYEAIVRRVLDEFDPKTETDFSENAGHAAKRRQLGDGQSKEAETVIPGAKGHRPAESLPIIPGYDVDGLLGRGGMGVVYDARQKSLGRRVAIKMVLAGELATAEDHTRFLAEAATIAHLRHPNIVQIFEVGEYQGRLFFALEHLEGGSLRQKLRGEPMPPKPAAALIEKLAHAVDYAHQQGIVHRDLTPGNILLASDGEPKITDFGLAKHLSSAANLTATGAVMGTPQYMSPEQARGDTKSVGPAADIYALGAILYEALTGRPPFIGGNAMEVIVQVTGDEPMPVTRLNRGVPQDLGTICMKCLEKPQARRYATAAALAEDLRRFQDGEPISARRVSEWERAWKWARRRPLVAASLAIAVVALIAGTIISTIFAFEADERRSDAVARRNDAVTAAKEARKQQSQTQRREALLLFQNAVTMAEAKGQITPALHMMLAAAQAAPPDDVAFDRVVRANLAAWLPQAAELRMILPPAPRGLSHWGISPDSRWLLSAENADSGRLRIWDAATGELRYTLAGPSPTIEPKRRCAFHPNGQWLAVALTLRGGREADTLRVYDLATGTPRGADLNASGINALRFTPDGKLLLAAAGVSGKDEPGLVYRWDASTLEPAGAPWQLEGAGVDLEFSSSGERLLVCQHQRAANADEAWKRRQVKIIWQLDARTGERTGKPLKHHDEYVLAGWGAYHPSGQEFVTKDDGGVQVWDAQTGDPLRDLGSPSYSVSFHPGAQLFMRVGGLVSTKRADLEVGCWDTTSGLPRGEASFQSSAVLTPDGDGLLTEGGRSVYLWRRGQALCRPAEVTLSLNARLPRFALARRGAFPRDFVIRPDGSQAMSGYPWSAACAFDPWTGKPFGPPIPGRLTGVAPAVLASSPDGQQYAVNQGDGVVGLYDAKTGQLAGPLLAAARTYVWSLAYSPDGKLLAIGHNGPIAIWERNGLRPPRLLPQDDAAGQLVFSPDSRRLAACIYPDWRNKPGMQLWNPASGEAIGPYYATEDLPKVVFSPNSRTLVLIDRTMIRRLDAETGKEAGPAMTFPRRVNAVAFLPDGRRFLTGGGDLTIPIWDALTGERVSGGPFVTWMGAGVVDLVVHPDGRQVLVVLANNTVQRWDLESKPALPLGPPIALRCLPGNVGFTHDGRSVFTVTTDGDVRFWPIAAPIEGSLDRFAEQLAVRTGLTWNPALGHPVAIERDEWLKRRQALAEKLPSPPSDDDVLARDAEQDGNTFAVRWHLGRLLRERPNDPMLYLRRAHNAVVAAGTAGAGTTETRAQLLGEAAADYDKAAACGAGPFLADWYSQRSVDCHAAGWRELARWYLDRARALAPADPRIKAVRATVLPPSDRSEEAATEWAAAVDGMPAQWYWRFRLAEVLGKQGRYAEQEVEEEKMVLSGGASMASDVALNWGRRNKWAKSAALFAQLRDKGPFSLLHWQGWAVCLLLAPDPEGYRGLCQRLVRPSMPNEAMDVAIWIVTRGPDGLTDWQPLLSQAEAWARPSSGRPDDRPQRLALYGALLYRAGRYAEAVERLREAVAADKQGGNGDDWLLLAMAHHRLGHESEAQQWLARGRSFRWPTNSPWPWQLASALLHREAEQLIDSKN